MTPPDSAAGADEDQTGTDTYQGFRDALGQEFECTVIREEERSILKIRGSELDLGTEAAVRGPLLALLDEKPPVVLVDAGELSFIDSSGIGMLVMAQRVAENQGTQLLFTGFQAQPLNAIQICGLDQIFAIEP
ncbi:MAG: putative Anti-sigma factor antagonist [Actinomycetia bacterium]|nr:putative Anti-sigma factor antagonist [Actinomycetes bacterium]